MYAVRNGTKKQQRKDLEGLVRERTEELERANERLLLANQCKGEFLAHMSKELRTPLNYIIDLAVLLLDGMMGKLNEEQQASLGAIAESSGRLRASVDKILELCNIDIGMTRFLPKSLPVVESLAKLVERVYELSEKRGIVITLQCQENLGSIIVDENKFSFILEELLTNALKFSARGSMIRVAARKVKVDRNGERNYLEISVADQGAGVRKDDLERIFSGFEKGIVISAENGSLGLGLALVKRFVELHGGRIWVDSSPGEGSTFTYILPMEGPMPAGTAAPRILLADGDPGDMQFLSHFLNEEGYEVITATDGVEAFNKGIDSPPDLFVIALQLAGMGGIDVCLRLKGDAGTKHVPVVIVAPGPAQLENIRSTQVGADAFFTKPLDVKELLPRIKSLITQKLNYEFLKRNYEIALFQASTDAMTGLFNQRRLWLILDRELARSRRYGRFCSLAMIDIDNFKEYNDRYGHLHGDEVLKQVADIFRKQIRNSDIAARYGGEEFVVVMPETGNELAVHVGEKLRRAFADYPFPQEDTQPGGRLTISIGIATFPQDAASARELIEMADKALYRAKGEGKNRVRAWTE
ncbi:MAG TPA: diguanylate cyclase [Geobacteraceae bacterium]|nr:diguanylate cyclase [Geobacteraceae bacterium]